MKINDCYEKKPIFIKNEIPIFSESDFYTKNYEKISNDHLKFFEKENKNPFMEERHWIEIEESTALLVKKYLKKMQVKSPKKNKLKILDVGVGMGRLLSRFPDFDRYGLDIAPGYLNHAKKRGIEVCLSKIENMPYKENYFDLITCTDVLEHVLDLNLSINKIISCLKIGGFFIVRVPYKEKLNSYLAEGYPYELVHLRNFDENSLRLQFEKIHNLKTLDISYTGYLAGNLKRGSENRIFSKIFREMRKIISKFNYKLEFIFCKKTCQPDEINIVIQK